MNTTIYHFDPITCEYLGQSEADESPLEPGVLLLPAHVTRQAPPPTGERETAVFDAEANAWLVIPDCRAIDLYSVHDGSPVAVADLGPQPPDTTDHPRPTLFHDWTGTVWTENMAKIKADKWESIKAKRDAIKAGGVMLDTKWYHTDADSRIQHLGLKDQGRDLLSAGNPDTTRLQKLGNDVRWKTMDGSFVYLTVKHALDIVAAVGDLDALAFTAAETHRAAMEASADPASYDFSGGWPPVYEI